MVKIRKELFGPIHIEIENKFEYYTLLGLFKQNDKLLKMFFVKVKGENNEAEFQTKKVIDEIRNGLEKI